MIDSVPKGKQHGDRLRQRRKKKQKGVGIQMVTINKISIWRHNIMPLCAFDARNPIKNYIYIYHCSFMPFRRQVVASCCC
mmetsp:Transcript_24318/g.51751  ORF Transcript_24318/g.51751 Transcript_24318/m.51751 type:complete len:80 (-) Transcript_24318:30-269(-)